MNSKELELRNEEITNEVRQLHNEIKELENEELRNEELRGEKLKKELLERYSKDELRMANRLLMNFIAVDMVSYNGYKYEKPVIKELSFSERGLKSLDGGLKQMLAVDLLEA